MIIYYEYLLFDNYYLNEKSLLRSSFHILIIINDLILKIIIFVKITIVFRLSQTKKNKIKIFN